MPTKLCESGEENAVRPENKEKQIDKEILLQNSLKTANCSCNYFNMIMQNFHFLR